MYPRHAMCSVLVGFLLAGCRQEPDGPTTGDLAGQVRAPHASGEDVVPGALVSIVDGPSTVADDGGWFRFEDLPAGDVVVRIEGPRAAELGHPFVYGTNTVTADITAGGQASLFPALLLGCEWAFDAADGAILDLAPCGAGGNVGLTFEAGDLVTSSGADFDGLVRAEVAALDPDTLEQITALPPFASLTEVYGGVEVRLADALSGEALQVAAGETVGLSIPLADPGDLEEVLALASFDPASSAWQEEAVGTVVATASGPAYLIEAGHFSVYSVASTPPPETDCIYVSARIAAQRGQQYDCDVDVDCVHPDHPNDRCVEGQCQKLEVDVRAYGIRAVEQWRRVDAATCVPVLPGRLSRVVGRAVGVGPARVFEGQQGPVDAPAEIDLELLARPVGCIEGTVAGCGAYWVEDQQSAVSAFLAIEPCTAAPFCADVPLQEPLTLRSPSGESVVVVPDASSQGSTCATGVPACQPLGLLSLAPPAVKAAIRATYRATTRRATGSTWLVDLDASASEGEVHTYHWRVEEVDSSGVDSPTLQWVSTTDTSASGVTLDPGSYRACVRVDGERYDWDQECTDMELPSADYHLLTVTVASDSSVTVTAPNEDDSGLAIDCSPSGYPLCLHFYAADTPVTLTAHPNSPFAELDHWTVEEGGGCDGSSALNCALAMDQDLHVTATFTN